MSYAVYDPTNVGNAPGSGPLRAGGRAPTGDVSRDADLPSTPTPAVEAQQPALQLVRDLWGGTQTVRAAGQRYLPREPGEDATNYAVRLRRSVFFNVFRNTVEGLAGFVFRADPILGDDVPPVIAEHWENIDNAGTHGDVFLRQLLVDEMTAGHAGILVEYPNVGLASPTLADEQSGGLRPYWVPIRKDDIVSVRMGVLNGILVLTQMVLREVTMVDDGLYGSKEQTRYRVLTRDLDTGVVAWRVEEITKDRQVMIVDFGTFRNQVEIPVAEAPSAGRTAPWVSQPQFSDLAYLNVAHYQQWSDYATSIHKTNVPVFVTSGVDTDGASLVIGPNTGLNFPAPDAKAYYVSHDGAALAASEAALDDLKNDMAALGLAAMATSKRAAETATAKEIDKSASDSALAVSARGLQDAVERALGFHGRYLGLDGGSISINRQYSDTRMDAADVMAWATLAEKLGVPLSLVLDALKAGGWIPDDVELDDIVLEAMANQQSIADQKAEDAAALAAKMSPSADAAPVEPPVDAVTE
jgi:Domain of unknown function (DUF4055)